MELALIIIGLVLLLAIMIYVSKNPGGLDRNYFKKRWGQIERAAIKDENSLRLAVIDGDKLVDQALKARRIHGDTMGERMKNASHLKHINALWSAHKLRNRLVHDNDVRFKKSSAKAAIDAYKKVLKELGAL